MTPRPIDDILTKLPNVSPELAEKYLDQLDDHYFDQFPPETIANHLDHLINLDLQSPICLLVNAIEAAHVDASPNQPSQRTMAITILSIDYPAAFSLITGILSSRQFSIQTGDSYTLQIDDASPPPSLATSRSRRRTTYRRRGGPSLRRSAPSHRIIDHFTGTVTSDQPIEQWISSLERSLQQAANALADGDQTKLNHLKSRVNEGVISQLTQMPQASDALLWPVEITFLHPDETTTILRVIGQDTPMFLYTLSTALSLHRLSITHLLIRTHDDHIEDQFHLIDAQGQAIKDRQTLEKVKLSVLLIKQFFYFLGQSPDPFTALCRFEQLTIDILATDQEKVWLDLLSNPRAMNDLAKLLGASDYLWEEFVRSKYDDLAALLRPHAQGRQICPPMNTFAERIQNAIDHDAPYNEKIKSINRLKDHLVFRIDLDHLLTPNSDFKRLSVRLSCLVESVIAAIADLTYAQLSDQKGCPTDADGRPIPWAFLGLGKLGGRALGYASDIELLFIYGDAQTDRSLLQQHHVFFEQMVRQTTDAIQAKSEGIFEVDLRLRPYGISGPLACSYYQYIDYFQPTGPAHPMERLAQIRLRSLHGDPALCEAIESARDQFIYTDTPLDTASLIDIRQQGYLEKKADRHFNAKFSCGALLDLESSIQMLQQRHGAAHEALRTCSIQKALTQLAHHNLITDADRTAMIEAYDFFRHLINGLRMLRGNAKDLCLPASDSDERLHLARRIGYDQTHSLDPLLNTTTHLQRDLDYHLAQVRCFVDRYLGRQSLPDPTIASLADLLLLSAPTHPTNNEDQPTAPKASLITPTLATINQPTSFYDDLAQTLSAINQTTGTPINRSQLAYLSLMLIVLCDDLTTPAQAIHRLCAIFQSSAAPNRLLHQLIHHPDRLRTILQLIDTSAPIAQCLTQLPDLITWLACPKDLLQPAVQQKIEQFLR